MRKQMIILCPGGHPDVVVNDGRIYLFYFTHPGRTRTTPRNPVQWRTRERLSS